MKNEKDFDMNDFVSDGTHKSGAVGKPRTVDALNVGNETSEPNVSTSLTGDDAMSMHTPHIAQSEPGEAIASTALTTSAAPTTDTADSTDTRTTTDTDPTRRTVKQMRGELDEYKRRYMQTPKIEDRKPVFISRHTRDRLDRIVRLLGERGMSVSGLIETIAAHHLATHEPDIEYWRRM
jgi:hypothetical protein